LPGVNGALEEETGRLDLGVIGSHRKSWEVMGSGVGFMVIFGISSMKNGRIMDILDGVFRGSSHGSEFFSNFFVLYAC
jgi:hypothetical protein